MPYKCHCGQVHQTVELCPKKDTMRYTDFTDYLSQRFAECEGNHVLDDEFPDAFDEWLQDLDVDLIIKYADMYKKT